MTNEEREAIDKLTNGEKMDFVTLVRTFKKEGIEKFAVIRKEYLDKVLSLIKEQQEEIEKYEKIYKEYDCYRWVKELDKKDKQIDLMAEELWREFYLTYMNGYGINSKEELKQYFERKVEEC